MRTPHTVVLAVLCLLLSSASQAQQGFSCPEAQRVRMEPPKWKARVLASAAGSPKLTQALAELRFNPDSSLREKEDECQEPFKVVGVDLFQADLTDAAEKDTVVQVRMMRCEEVLFQKTDGLRIAVLRPLGKGEYCRLGGDELSLDQHAWNSPCLGKAAKLPRIFSFVNLVDPKRQALLVKDQGGSCEGTGRSAHYELSYWVAEGATMNRVFSAVTYDASYTSPIPPSQEQVGKVQLRGGFPKTIVLTEETHCLALDEEDEEERRKADPSGCKPSLERTEYHWREGSYVKK